jgi:putative ABC transport system permease protein
MNLAYKDIHHNFGRFVLTTLGVSLLLMLVMGMAGIYRGLVVEATQLVDRIDADLWIVQKDTRGPFAEISRVPRSIEQRALTVPGVASANGFVSHTIQRERNGKPFRVTIQGLSWPLDKGQWLPLVAGGAFSQSHYQMIADRKLGLSIGEFVDLGNDTYTVVGLTDGMVSQSGDPMAFLTLSDSQAVQFDLPGEAIRVERATRIGRLERSDMGRTQPQLQALAGGPAAGIAALGTSTVSAVLVDVRSGHDPSAVASIISAWPDVSVYSHATQRDFLLRGNVDRARRQLGLFRVLLIIVSCIIMALILYTLTLDKLHDIAMLKLMGARNGMILGLIMQQALLMGVLGYGLAFLIGQWTFPHFPRKVILAADDLYQLAAIVLVISVLASLIGIIKALRVEPNEVLA